jgi:molybdopterin converting factor small subunit
MQMNPHIQLKLFATLRKYLPQHPEAVPIEPGVTIRDLILQLGIPVSDVKLIFIDNVRSDLSSRLKGGERIGLFPPVGGG